MKKIFGMFIMFISILLFKSNIYAYESYKVGDLVIYNKDYYYVIEDSNENFNSVKLLKKDPLSPDEINKSEWIKSDTGELSYGWRNYFDSTIDNMLYFWANSFGNDVLNVRLLKSDEFFRLRENEQNHEWLYDGYEYWTMSKDDYIQDSFYYIDNRSFDYNYLSLGKYSEKHFVRPVIELRKTVIERCKKEYQTDKKIKYSSYSIGDIVTYNNEKYIVIEKSGKYTDYVVALKSNRLSVGDIRFTYRCDHGGCGTNYEESTVKSTIESWKNSNIRDEDTVEIDGYKVRLLTLDDLVNNLGYEMEDYGQTGYHYVGNIVNEIDYAYWTMSFCEDSSYCIYTVDKNANIGWAEPANKNSVKPVVNFKKCALDGGCEEEDYIISESNCIKETPKIEDDEENNNNNNELVCREGINYSLKDVYEYNKFEVGNEIQLNGEKYYVIENSDSTKKYVTLLKDEPLTVGELYKYGRDENGELFVNKNVINPNDPEKVVYEYSNGSGGIAYFTSDYCKVVGEWRSSYYEYEEMIKSGCNFNYAKSDVKKVVENWASDVFNDKLVSVGGYKARLLSVDDLVNNLFYDENYLPTKDLPWIKIQNKYWLMTDEEDSDSEISSIYYNGHVYNSGILEPNVIRPVINIDKCVIDGGCSTKKQYVEDGCIEDREDFKFLSACERGINYINKKIIDYKVFNIGDEVEYKGEKYLAIRNSDEKQNYVTLIKNKGLTVEELYKYGRDKNNHLFVNENIINLDNPEKIIYELDDGVGGMAYYTKDDCKQEYSYNGSAFINNEKINIGCNNNYNSSDVKKVVDNWASDVFGDNLVKADGYKARLINRQDLIKHLGYETDSQNTGYYLRNNQENNIFNNDNISYWTMIPYEDSFDYVFINNNKSFYNQLLLNIGGVRPVVNVDKCALNNGCKIQEITLVDGCIEESEEEKMKRLCKNGINYVTKKKVNYNNFEFGDEVEYNNELYYVIEDNDSNLSLLKDKPLTVNELYKYGRDKNDHLFINEYITNLDDPEKVVFEYDNNIGGMAYYTKEDCKQQYSYNGSIFIYDDKINIGCNNNYNNSDIKKVVDNWSNDVFKDKLVSVDGYKARLIKYDELISKFGFEFDSMGTDYNITPDVTPNWLINSNPYWVMDYYDDGNFAAVISKYQNWKTEVFKFNAVRPVVNVDKCAIDGGCDIEEIQVIDGCIEDKDSKVDDKAAFDKKNNKNNKTDANVDNTSKNKSNIIWIIFGTLLAGGLSFFGYGFIRSKKELFKVRK